MEGRGAEGGERRRRYKSPKHDHPDHYPVGAHVDTSVHNGIVPIDTVPIKLVCRTHLCTLSWYVNYSLPKQLDQLVEWPCDGTALEEHWSSVSANSDSFRDVSQSHYIMKATIIDLHSPSIMARSTRQADVTLGSTCIVLIRCVH